MRRDASRRRLLVLLTAVGTLAAMVLGLGSASAQSSNADLSVQVKWVAEYQNDLWIVEISVQNAGPSGAIGPLNMTIDLDNATFDAGPSSGWSCTPGAVQNPNTTPKQRVTCTFPPGLAANDQTGFTIRVKARCDNSGVPYTASATVTSQTIDPNVANNQSSKTQPNSGDPLPGNQGSVCGASDTAAPATTYRAPTQGPPSAAASTPATLATQPAAAVSTPASPSAATAAPAAVSGTSSAASTSATSSSQAALGNTGASSFREIALGINLLFIGAGLVLLARSGWPLRERSR